MTSVTTVPPALDRHAAVRWMRDHPDAADVVLGVLVAIPAVLLDLLVRVPGHPRPSVLGVMLALASSLPIVWRRRRPITVLAVVVIAQMWLEAINAPTAGWIGVIIATYTLGAYSSGRRLWRTAVVLVVAVTAWVAVGLTQGTAPWVALITVPVSLSAVVLFGDMIRRRREREAEQIETAARAERERLLLVAAHVQEERAGIARELHDVVAHSVSSMVIQAGAARRQLTLDPASAKQALLLVEETGRQAMTEMRRILGVLRADGSSAVLTPLPSIGSLGALVDSVSDLPVRYRAGGDLGDVPSGVEASAYRIVQEALTNVRRHAGAVRSVDVSVTRRDGVLVVEVADDGRGSAADIGPAGFGLVGMAERVAAFGGELVAGPRPGGGWRVRALLPVVPA